MAQWFDNLIGKKAPAVPATSKDLKVQDDPNELIKQQYMAARKNLGGQRQQAQEEMQMALNRQQALTGLSGGAAIKTRENVQRSIGEGFAQAEAGLAAEESKALQAQDQFARQYNTSREQFDKQMKLATDEFDLNKKTIFWNVMSNLAKMNVKDKDWARFAKQYEAGDLNTLGNIDQAESAKLQKQLDDMKEYQRRRDEFQRSRA